VGCAARPAEMPPDQLIEQKEVDRLFDCGGQAHARWLCRLRASTPGRAPARAY
jgi:hypothetical protein